MYEPRGLYLHLREHAAEEDEEVGLVEVFKEVEGLRDV